MQRYTVKNNDPDVATDGKGDWVKYIDVKALEARARQLGYDDLDDALLALAVYREKEGY